MGYGDDMMAAYYARRQSRKIGRKVALGNGKRYFYSEVFDNNPYLYENPAHKGAPKLPRDAVWVDNYPGFRPYIDYSRSTDERLVFVSPEDRGVGDVFFTKDELELALDRVKELIPFILIEPSFKGRVSSTNKDWGIDKWRKVSQALSGDYNIVQVVHQYSTPLGSAACIEVSSFRESLAILYYASYFLGSEGGMHHASAALGVPGQVIFGGFISPEITGYTIHRNHYVDSEQSPCGALLDCEHCREAMDSISPELVVDAAASSRLFHINFFLDRLVWIRMRWIYASYRKLRMMIFRKLTRKFTG